MLDTHANDLLAARTIVAGLIDLAGPDYSWSEARGHTIDSAHRQGLVAILADRQQGLCVACGDALAGERYDFCHLVSDPSGRGMIPGSGYVGHTSCNSDDAKEWGYVVPVESLIRLDLWQTSWPSRSECVARSEDMRQTRKIRRQNRIATASL